MHTPNDNLSQEEKGFLEALNMSMEKSIEVEKLTLKKRENKLYFQNREKRITSVAHKIFIRQTNFEVLVTSLHTPKDNLPKSTKCLICIQIWNKK